MHTQFLDEVFDELLEEGDEAGYEEDLLADEAFGEDELSEDYFQPEPYQWPRSRTFNPSAPSVPAGPPRTFSPCQAITDDFSRLTLAVGDLKNQLRQRPSNLGRVRNRADVTRAVGRQIVSRLSSRFYVQRGCTRQDMNQLASSVNVMRGAGADADVGSWPRASSPAVQAERTAARQSLRHLLNWARRATSMFPRI